MSEYISARAKNQKPIQNY